LLNFLVDSNNNVKIFRKTISKIIKETSQEEAKQNLRGDSLPKEEFEKLFQYKHQRRARRRSWATCQI